jgi:stage II sporulation protein M
MKTKGNIRRIIGQNKKYLLFGLALLIFGALIGYMNAGSIQQMAQSLLKELDRVAQKIQQHHSVFYTFWTIFENNLLAAISMIGLGVFFGIYPAFALLSNGILLGFILKVSVVKGFSPFLILLVGILPHGIVELTAIILAAAIGMKYGALFFRMFMHLLGRQRNRSIMKEFTASLNELSTSVGIIIILLLVAAVLESTLTPVLIHAYLGGANSFLKP